MKTGKYDQDQAAAIAHENCRGGKALYAAPAPVSLLDSVKQLFKTHPRPGLTIVKGADGLRTMFVVTSNGYKDREQEYITSKTLSDYVERAWIADDVCDTQNTLRFWHSKGAIGDVIWADMEGGTFLIEAAKERPDALIDLAMDGQPERRGSIKAAWDYVEASPDVPKWGASHGFKYAGKSVADDGTATYENIQKFETSVLPLSAAANPYTYSGVIDMTERNDVLDKIVGQAGAADRLRKGIQAAKVVLDTAGVEHKAIDDTKVKALLDALGTKTDSYLGGLMDAPPSGLKEAVMKLILSAIGETPTEEQPAETEPGMAGEEMPMGKARGQGQVKLLDDLIKTQDGLASDLQDLTKAVKGLEPLSTLAGVIQALHGQVEAQGKDIKTLSAQLGGRPRPASQATETIEDDKALKEKVEKALEKRDSFWGVPTQ